MKLQTERFGAIEVSEARVFTFAEGLPGFAGKRFAVIDDPTVPALEWLQSLDEPGTALMVVDPADVRPDYQIEPKPAEIRAVQPDEAHPEPIVLRLIVRGTDQPGALVLNLLAPILLNPSRRLAMQIPLVGSGFTVREPWPDPPPG